MIMARASLWGQLLIPLGFVVSLHWKNPWKASLAGYWLIPNPSHIGTGALAQALTMIVKTVVVIFNVWIMMFGINAPAFFVVVLYTSSINTLLCDIET